MKSIREKSNLQAILLIVIFLLLQNCLCSPPQRSSSVHGRYIRPHDRDYPKCTNSRCADTSDRDRDSYPKDGYTDDDYKTEKGGGADYQPKDDGYGVDDYKSQPKDDYPINPGASDYDRDHKPIIRDEYKPKPPVSINYNSKPIIKDDYDEKPVIGEEYKPKPVTRDDYNSKPRDDYDDKTVVIDEYKPKPPVRVDYSKPADRDTYGPKPVVRDEYGPKPSVTDRFDDYQPKPPARGNYDTKPVDRDVYGPKPSVVDEYKPKPPVRPGYNTRPITRDDYDTKPGIRDDYDTKPVIRDEYDTKPFGRDEYDSRPVVGDGYKPKPVVIDDYKPKPVVRDDYKPVEDHVPKPPIRGPYGLSSTGGGGGYNSGNPDKKEDDYKVPVGDVDGSKYDDDFNDDYKGGDPVPVAQDQNCICVPYYQCTEGHIVTDGAGIIDARKRPQPDEDIPLDGKFKPPSCGPFHVCCNTPESSTVKPYEHRCGVRNPSGINSRILSPSNKGEADFGEWPWQAAVLKSEGTVNIFQCGGVLIDKYHVLTVAHCVFHLYKYNDYPLKVRLGEWDTQTMSEFLAHEDYKVSKIIIHPEFRNTSLWNDVAILRLLEPVLFAPHIDTVCLPKYDENFSGQNCVVTGWGKDSYKGGTFSNVMKEVALQVIDNYGCEEMLRKTRLGRFFQLHEGFVCAGGEHGLDSCKGDGGGPLVCYRKDRSYALAGLVSWGIDCGQPGVPGVYIKVQKYLDWISKNTGVDLEDYWPKY